MSSKLHDTYCSLECLIQSILKGHPMFKVILMVFYIITQFDDLMPVLNIYHSFYTSERFYGDGGRVVSLLLQMLK